jgi:hypothetical protein
VNILPAAFLVRYRLPVARFDKLPRSGQKLLDLPESARLAMPGALDDADPPWELRAGWNPQGIGFSLTVTGRTIAPLANPDDPTRPDSLELWLDTRDTQSVHRATRYCHHLCVLPTGGGRDGSDSLTVPLPVARAREDAPLADSDTFLSRSRTSKTGYQVEVWIPGEALTGFDPSSQPRLGFCACLNDAEHGRRGFGVGDEFPFAADPSLWHTLELRDA